MLNGRSSPMWFTPTILSSLCIIILMMMTMIKDCEGSISMAAACNGSSSMECQLVLEELDEQEFLMDTEEHRRILQGYKGKIVYKNGLQPRSPACGNKCPGGRYDVAHRKPTLFDGSKR